MMCGSTKAYSLVEEQENALPGSSSPTERVSFILNKTRFECSDFRSLILSRTRAQRSFSPNLDW